MIDVHRPDLRLQVAMTLAVVATFLTLEADLPLRSVAVHVVFAVVFGTLGRILPTPYGGVVAVVIAMTITADPSESGQTVDVTVYALIAIAALSAAYGASRTLAIAGSLGFPVLVVVAGLQGDRELSSAALTVSVVLGLAGAVAFAADGRASGAGAARRFAGAGAVLAVIVPLAVLAALFLPQTDRSPGGRSNAGDGSTPPASYVGFGDELDVTDPVSLDDAVVMRVQSDQATYWRVQTFAAFDGQRWTETAAPIDPPIDASVPRQELVQRFEVERSMVGFLPTAWQPRELDVRGVSSEIRFDNTVSISGTVRSGSSYVVTGSRPLVGADDLRAASGPVPDDIAAVYLPGSVASDRVQRAAERLTVGLDNDYDRIRALEDWIGEQVVYTRDIAPMPGGVDAVDHFLFETQRGFCEQVGTSLVVMAQSLGIPARLAVGYVPVERDGGEWVVRSEHAHAWVEVYFPGVGWQGFDPTAGVPLAQEDRTEPAPDDESGIDWWPLAAWLAGGVVLAVGGAWLLRRRLGGGAGPAGAPAPDAAPWAPSVSDRLVELAARADVTVAPPRTIREIGGDLVARGADAEIAELVELLDREAFGGAGVTAEERERSAGALERLEVWVGSLPSGQDEQDSTSSGQDEQDSIEQPGRERAQSGRFSE
ncbi:MAG: DUF3488 and transglutaminase-like domain-containing protein [Actinomycetota bacterium]